jgi:phosphoribosylanthranilate isomerase
MMIKICGLTRPDDVRRAVECGATAVGFVLHRASPRAVPVSRLHELLDQAPRDVLTVAVIVVGDPVEINSLPVDAVQIHGLTHPGQVPVTRKRVLVATTARHVHRFPDHEIIVDESRGRGLRTALKALRTVDRPFILAGGLDVGSVGEFIHELKPTGVDVSSGVESSPGIKDQIKMRAFIDNARAAFMKRGQVHHGGN